jgi:ABC-2 type transport system permease protein
MKQWFEIYREFFKTSLALQFQYRVGMVIWMIDVILEPLIYLVVWQAAAHGDTISGYDARAFAGYFIVLLVVNHFTETWMMWEYDYIVRTGALSIHLLRPLHPIHRDISTNITYKVFMLIVVIPTIIVMIFIFRPTINPPLWAIPAMVPAVILSGLLIFFTGWIVAMAAFWTIRINAINQMYFLIMLFFSGRIAPLEVLPDALRTIANLLPFRWAIAFPVELFIGRLSLQQTAYGFMAQILWITICYILMGFAWRVSIRRYGAVGG